ncbi:MAG TPA: fibronectin type III domain-containing protein [Rhodothermales bacterium]|nr:fibronectin type III domain-containing protein [Rhodothermales bacterium]
MKRAPFPIIVLFLLGATVIEVDLDEVSLISPSDDSEDVALLPRFSWSPVDGAQGYQIQVSESRNMNNRVINVRGVAGTSFTPATPLDEDETHYWRVRALEDDGDEGPWSDRWSFETGKVPDRPSLSSPSHQEDDVPLSPQLVWQSTSGADSYRLEVSTNSDFSSLFFDRSGIGGTSLTLPVSLQSNRRYYWRVRASNKIGDGSYSDPRWFTTKESAAPGKVALSSPADNANGVSTTPTFSWQSAPGAQAYTLEVSGTSSFASLKHVEAGLTTTSFTRDTPFAHGDMLHWRVRATNSVGNGPYSDDREFATELGGPTQVTLVSPADGSEGVNTSPTLVWQAVQSASSYRVQVSTTQSFSGSLIRDTELSGTQLQVGPLVSQKTYFWRVRSSNAGQINWSVVRHFSTGSGAPAQVALQSPPNDAENQPLSVTLAWSAPAGAEKYNLQVALNQTFTTILVSETGLTATNYVLGGLQHSTDYYWRVQAANGVGTGGWSAARTFTTQVVVGPTAPAQVALQSPPNDADNQPLSVTLAWSAPTGAEKYNLQVALDQTFTTILVSEMGLTATNYLLGGLEHSTDYYWRVQAANGVGAGDWSAARTFTTGFVLGPAAPALIYPLDGADNVPAAPVFSWNETDGAESYKLELSTTLPDQLENFVTVVIAVVVQQTFFQSPPLSTGQDYFWRVESRNAAGSARSQVRSFRTVLTTSSETEELPTEFSLEQNYPNPFNPSTTIRYNLPEAADVELIVLDALGRVVDDLGSRRTAPGAHTVMWDAGSRPSGIYFVRMEAKGYVGLRRMVLLR